MTVFKKLNQGYRTSKSGLAVEVIGGDVVGKLFILSVEEDDLETAEKIMAFIESTELVMCTDLPSAPSALQGFVYRRCVPSSVLAGQIHRADPYGVRCISFAYPAARTGIFTKGDL